MEYEYLNIDEPDQKSETVLEQAGVSLSALTSLSVEDARKFAKEVLRAQARIFHPDIRGENETARVLSGLRPELDKGHLFDVEYQESLIVAKSFADAIKGHLTEVSQVESRIGYIQDEFLSIDLLSQQERSVVWNRLVNVEISFLESERVQKVVRDYYAPGQDAALKGKRGRAFLESHPVIEAPEMDPEDLRLSIDMKIAQHIEIMPGVLPTPYIKRLYNCFIENLKDVDPTLYEDYRTSLKLDKDLSKSDEELVEREKHLRLDDRLGEAMEIFKEKYLQNYPITESEYGDYNKIVVNEYEIQYRKQTAKKVISLTNTEINLTNKRAYTVLPEELRNKLFNDHSSTIRLDHNGDIQGARYNGQRLLMSHTCSWRGLEGFTILVNNKYLGIFAEEQVERFEEQGLARFVSEVGDFSYLPPVQEDGDLSTIKFDWQEHPQLLITISELSNGSYEVRPLGVVTSIRNRQ